MANLDDLYTSKYATAADFKAPKTLIITTSYIDELGAERQKKVVLECEDESGRQYSIPINKTNYLSLKFEWGPDNCEWDNKKIRVSTIEQEYQGRPKPGIYIQPLKSEQPAQPGAPTPAPNPSPQAATEAATAEGEAGNKIDDDIPF